MLLPTYISMVADLVLAVELPPEKTHFPIIYKIGNRYLCEKETQERYVSSIRKTTTIIFMSF